MSYDGNNQASDSRRATRSQSDSNPNLLAPPLTSFRRRRSPTRDERLLSPNHCEEICEEGIFQFPAPTAAMGTPDPTVAALTEALQGVRVSSRKPELPAFDSKNIDIWLKRVDNAYRRSGVTDPKDKFAFIEPKFACDTDPRINELLFGDCTAEDWTALETYLRGRYGRTKAQQASVILDGVQRDGKLPSEMFAFVKERVGTITVDDIIKEMVLRELPTDIRRTIHDKVKDLGGAETVKIADEYFDRNGKPLHKPAPSNVNAVNEVPGLIDTEDEADEVNAVGGRRFQRKGRPNRFPARNLNRRLNWPDKTVRKTPLSPLPLPKSEPTRENLPSNPSISAGGTSNSAKKPTPASQAAMSSRNSTREKPRPAGRRECRDRPKRFVTSRNRSK